MPTIVIGGHTRNIGKTSVVAGLIAALPHLNWTAIKITQFGHNVCSANGEPCDCQTADHTLAISEERNPTTGTDTSRFLAAGARRVFWVRTRQGELAEAMPRLRKPPETGIWPWLLNPGQCRNPKSQCITATDQQPKRLPMHVEMVCRVSSRRSRRYSRESRRLGAAPDAAAWVWCDDATAFG
jgi:hypothetical protein